MFCARLSLYLHVMQRKSSPACKKFSHRVICFFFVQKQRAEAVTASLFIFLLKIQPYENSETDKKRPVAGSYKQAIEGRHNRAVEKISELTGGTGNLSDFADGYLYFGLHKENGHWVFREWAPNANAIYLIGNFSNWKERPEYRLLAIGRGVWEIKLPLDTLHHLDFYKLSVHWPEDKENAFRLGPRESCKTRNIYLLGTNLGSRKAFRFFKKAVSPQTSRC